MGAAIVVNWWALAIRGIVGIALGIAAFAWTGITLRILIAIFAAYLLVDGVFALVAAIRGQSWLVGLEGALGIAVAIVAVLWPGITVLALLLLVAAWAVLTGIVEIAAAVFLRRVLRNEWLLALAGIVSVAFGIVLVLNPVAGLITIVWLIGAYALITGILSTALAFRLRGNRATFVAYG
jgi:uncharacterized membrane protein HdeD (DUF308 family)